MIVNAIKAPVVNGVDGKTSITIQITPRQKQVIKEFPEIVGKRPEPKIIVRNRINPKLKQLSITLWTVSGVMMTKSAAGATGFWEQMQPLFWTFQEMALGLGALAIITGLVMLVFKRRWGISTLKTTGFIVGGVFLIPSVLMLLAIVGTMLNDALYEALQNIRESKEVIKGGQ